MRTARRYADEELPSVSNGSQWARASFTVADKSAIGDGNLSAIENIFPVSIVILLPHVHFRLRPSFAHCHALARRESPLRAIFIELFDGNDLRNFADERTGKHKQQ